MPPVPLRSGLSWVFRNLAEDHGAHTQPAEILFTGAVRTFLHLRDRSQAQRHKGLRIVETPRHIILPPPLLTCLFQVAQPLLGHQGVAPGGLSGQAPVFALVNPTLPIPSGCLLKIPPWPQKKKRKNQILFFRSF